MIGHYDICPDLEPFMISAIGETVKDDITIYFPCKYIYPIYDRECQEVSIAGMIDVVTGGHDVIKIGEGGLLSRFVSVCKRM